MNDDLQDEYDEHPGLEAHWTLSLDRLHGCAEHAAIQRRSTKIAG